MKKVWKKSLCVLLAAVMTFSAAGCGKKDKDGDQQGSSQPGVAISQEEKAKQAMEGVFRASEISVANLENGKEDYGVIGTKVVGDKIVMTLSYMDGGLARLQKVTCDFNGQNAKTVELKPHFDDSEGYGLEDDSFYRSTSYGNIVVLDDGAVIAIRNYYLSVYEDYTQNVEEYYVDIWDAEGNPVSETKLEGLGYNEQEGTYRYVYGYVEMPENSCMYILSGDKFESVTVKADGSVSAIAPFNAGGETSSLNIERIVSLGEGRAAITSMTEDWSKMMVKVVNLATGAVEREGEVPESVRNQGFYNLFPGKTSDFIFSTYAGIFTYSVGDTESKKMLDFVNSDLNLNYLSSLFQVDEDRIIGTYQDEELWKPCVSLFTRVPADQLVQKEILTLAGLYINYDYELKKRVIDFNKTNDSYRITMKDYSEYNTEEDYSAGLTRLNNDIMANKCPDILRLDNQMPYTSFAKKGLFADIDELIQKDEELSKNEYMDNVLDAFRVDGKLYQIIPTFCVETQFAKKSLVGNVKSITLEEAKQVLPKMAANATLFGSRISRETFMNRFMYFCGSDFVNYETNTCDFDTKEFQDFLTEAKNYKTEEEMSSSGGEYDEDYWREYESQYRENRTLFYSAYIASMQDLKYTIGGYIGEDVAYVGYPSAANGGSILSPYGNAYAIYSKSSYMDGAWEFLRYFLTRDYQTSENRWGCSILKDVLKDDLKKNMEKNVWVDEVTGQEYNQDVFYIYGQEIPFDPLTQAQVDEFFDFISSIRNVAFNDTDIMNIINEEAAAFFSGQKPVSVVTGIIQSRVNLYLNE